MEINENPAWYPVYICLTSCWAWSSECQPISGGMLRGRGPHRSSRLDSSVFSLNERGEIGSRCIFLFDLQENDVEFSSEDGSPETIQRMADDANRRCRRLILSLTKCQLQTTPLSGQSG